MTSAGRQTLRIVVTGFSPSIRDLCDDLARQQGIELVGAAGRVAEAAWAFNAHYIDVVVHATHVPQLPKADITEIRQYTSSPIVLLAEEATPTLFEQAMDADIADLIVLPEPPEHVAFAVHKAARIAGAAAVEQSAPLITVFSPKGGTGKTVIATNLAATFAKRAGLRTLLVDLDLQFGDAAIMLGVEPQRTLYDLVTAPGELDPEKIAGYLTKHGPSGLDVLVAPLRPEEGDLVNEPKVERLFEVAGTTYDSLLVDTSPSFHGPMLSALDRTDVLLLVSTPEVPTLKNVRLGLETLRKLGFPQDRIRLLLNRADAEGGIGPHEVEAALDVPVSFELPNAPELPATVNSGVPLALSAPDSAFGQGIHEIVEALMPGTDVDAAAARRARGGLAGAVRGLAGGWLRSKEKPTASSPETSV
jgi:pilus assembly protein CpaE